MYEIVVIDDSKAIKEGIVIVKLRNWQIYKQSYEFLKIF